MPVVSSLVRLGHWLVPALFMGIGLIIVLRSGVLPRVLSRP